MCISLRRYEGTEGTFEGTKVTFSDNFSLPARINQPPPAASNSYEHPLLIHRDDTAQAYDWYSGH